MNVRGHYTGNAVHQCMCVCVGGGEGGGGLLFCFMTAGKSNDLLRCLKLQKNLTAQAWWCNG